MVQFVQMPKSLIMLVKYICFRFLYPQMWIYLETLDEENKRHAIADIEYMLEQEYKINDKIITEHSKDKGNWKFISYLASLDEKTCRHAVVDIEYLLESEYGAKSSG